MRRKPEQEEEKEEEEPEPHEKRFRELEKFKEDRRRSEAFSEGSSDSKRNSILLGILEDDPLKYLKQRVRRQESKRHSDQPSVSSGIDTLELK